MRKPRTRAATIATLAVLATCPELPSQTSPDAALATATALALEPGVRAALKADQPVSFEYRSAWGQTVKTQLEESLGLSLSAEHRRGAARILLDDPSFAADTASVEVYFGRCEPVADTETLKVRVYAFAFVREGGDYRLLRSARLGTTEGSCEGDWQVPPAAQA